MRSAIDATAPTLADIQAAREADRRASRASRRSSRSETLSRLAGRTVWLKAENLQRTGSFKIRGAFNRIATLTDAERAAGVVAASAGNHGQAVAWAAREAGSGRPSSCRRTRRWRRSRRRRATARASCWRAAASTSARRGAGAAWRRGRPSSTPSRTRSSSRARARSGSSLRSSCPEVETVVVPIGGGGLAAGIALALRRAAAGDRLVGVQAAACAPFAGQRAEREHDRGRDRRQAAGRADESLLAGALESVVDRHRR